MRQDHSRSSGDIFRTSQYFDLEDPVIAQLLEQAMTALQDLPGLVVIDEAQRQPGLFPVLRALAGRVEIIEMHGFDLCELPSDAQASLWQRGDFPRSYLAADD